MIIKGIVTSGAVRGGELIQMYEDRISHILGFKPFRGTLDIQIEKPVVVEDYATRRIEHILLNGRQQVYAYLAPVHLRVVKSAAECDCWIIKPEQSFSKNTIEIISTESMRKKYDLRDGDAVEITFFKKAALQRKKPITRFLKRISGKETRISR